MKGSSWLWIGAAALAAYLYLTKDSSAYTGGGAGGGAGLPDPNGQGNPNANAAPKSETTAKGLVTAGALLNGSGISPLGPVHTSTLGVQTREYNDPLRMASTTGKFTLEVTKAARDAAGLSNFDKIILKNKGLAATTANAKKAGLL